MNKTHIVKVPKLKAGDDKAIADVLTKRHARANEATKMIFDTGLLCFFIKENLDHGQFGPWLQAHCPDTMWRMNTKTGKAVASSTLSWQMGFTKGLVEKCGTTVTKLLSQIPKVGNFGEKGEFLQLAAGSELLLKAPEQVVKVHADASKMVEGKTAYQLFWDFKQAEDREELIKDEEGVTQQPAKPGRRKKEGGLTKEQREAAAARDEQERLESLQSKADEVTDWLLEHADVKGFAKLDEIEGGAKTLKNLADAVACAHTFFSALKKSTK
jgi:hypothetical protein